MKISQLLNVVSLKQDGAHLSIITDEQLTEFHQANQIIYEARKKAAQYLCRARRLNYQQKQHHLNQLVKKNDEIEQKSKEYFSHAKQEGAKAGLTWLVSQQGWEKNVYEQLTKVIAKQLSQRLGVISQHIAWESLLIEDIHALYKEFKQNEPLILNVSPELFMKITAELSAPNLEIKIDESLNIGEARLESVLVAISIKIPNQLDEIKIALSQLHWEQLYEPD
ncbi:hypothetical protein ACAX46_004272 [Providencia rettgeri]